jgi:hypothetical protein
MTDFPTTPTSGVRSVRKPATNDTPTTTRLWGVGVWCGYKKPEIAGGENPIAVRLLRLQIQAGCREYGA